MKRREFITLLGGAAATWPLAARAEQAGKVYRIGFLANDPTIPTTAAGAAFRDGLSKGGFVEGDNILIDWRFAEGRADRYAELASTLVRLRMDLIVASSGLSAIAAKQATRVIPIVFLNVSDPVGQGIDRRSKNPSLAHAKKERVSLFGTDQRITSGPAARRPHSKAEYMTAPEHFADSQFPLAPRAPSIHDPLRHWRLRISASQTDRCRPSRKVTKFCFVARVEVQKYTPDRFPHRRLDRQIEKMIQRLFTKATR